MRISHSLPATFFNFQLSVVFILISRYRTTVYVNLCASNSD
jgi:hypothetical protein